MGRVELRVRVLLDLCESVGASLAASRRPQAANAHRSANAGACGTIADDGDGADDGSAETMLHDERVRLLAQPADLEDDFEFASSVAAIVGLVSPKAVTMAGGGAEEEEEEQEDGNTTGCSASNQMGAKVSRDAASPLANASLIDDRAGDLDGYDAYVPLR